MPEERLLHVAELGRVAYGEALVLQRDVARARGAGDIAEDVLLLVEHPPVVTLGRSARTTHLLATPELLRARGVELYEVERGGDVTFHGPGQLVGYPVLDLRRHRRDLHWYLRQLEEALIHALAAWEIPAARSAGQTGVWAGDRKIASIGVHARDWVTWHGFALNITTDLSYFDLIVPCGIAGVRMTSMAAECDRGGRMWGGRIGLTEVGAEVARAFGEVFSVTPRPVDAEALTVSAIAGSVRCGS